MSDDRGRIITDTTRLAQPKHVWVDVTGRWDGDHHQAGLLVMWRRYDRGGRGNLLWQGWVMRADLLREGEEPTLTHSWVDAANIRPVKYGPEVEPTEANGESRPTPA